MSLEPNLCGKRVKIARVSADLKQVDLIAALSVEYKIDMTQRALSDIELGKRAVKDTELVAFAKVLNVNPIWLLFGDKVPEFRGTPLEGS